MDKAAKHDWKVLNSAKGLPYGKASRVQQIVDEYQLSDRFRRLGRRTRQNYLGVLINWKLTRLPNNKTIFDLYVHKVDHPTVNHFLRTLRFKYKTAHIAMMCTVMSMAWKIAIKNGRAAYNPWVDLDLSIDNERDVVWTEMQVQLAISTAKDMGYKTLALYLLVMYETGQRPWVDLRDLTWDNIEEAEDEHGCKYHYINYRTSKTGTRLYIPLSDRCYAAIKEHCVGLGFLFAEKEGTRRTAQALHYQYTKVKRKAGLNDKLQFRDLRRTAACELAETGATPEEFRAIFGWTKAEQVIHRYSRIRLRTAVNGMRKRNAGKSEGQGGEVRTEPEPTGEHAT